MLTIPRGLLHVDAAGSHPYYPKRLDDTNDLRVLRAVVSIVLALLMVLLGLVGKGVLALAACRPRRIPLGVALIGLALLLTAAQGGA